MDKNVEVSLLLSFYSSMLTSKQAEAINLYYNQDLSLSEISENIGITRQGVRDNIKRAENTLYDIENRLKHIEKFLKIQNQLSFIDEKLNNIEDKINVSEKEKVSEDIKIIRDIINDINETY